MKPKRLYRVELHHGNGQVSVRHFQTRVYARRWAERKVKSKYVDIDHADVYESEIITFETLPEHFTKPEEQPFKMPKAVGVLKVNGQEFNIDKWDANPVMAKLDAAIKGMQPVLTASKDEHLNIQSSAPEPSPALKAVLAYANALTFNDQKSFFINAAS